MWDCPAGHGIPIRQGHRYLRKIWKFSNGCVSVFGLKRASCIFISSRDRVTCIIWVLGELSEMLHTSWPTGFMSLCIDSDLCSYGLSCVSFWNEIGLWLPVCEKWCLWQCADSLYVHHSTIWTCVQLVGEIRGFASSALLLLTIKQ